MHGVRFLSLWQMLSFLYYHVNCATCVEYPAPNSAREIHDAVICAYRMTTPSYTKHNALCDDQRLNIHKKTFTVFNKKTDYKDAYQSPRSGMYAQQPRHVPERGNALVFAPEHAHARGN